MKLLRMNRGDLYAAAFFLSSIAMGLFLRLLFARYLQYAKGTHLRALQFLNEIYKLGGLTDNVKSVLLAEPDKRDEVHYPVIALPVSIAFTS